MHFEVILGGRGAAKDIRGMTSPVLEAEVCFQIGLDCEAQQLIAEAEKFYKKAIKLNPKAAGAWVNLGTIAVRRSELDEAERCYMQAVSVAPNYPLAWFNLGTVREEQNRAREAEECLNIAIRLNPCYADAIYNLAVLCYGLERFLEAYQHFKKFLKAAYPSDPWMLEARFWLIEIRKKCLPTIS